jgi:hypothetical protein
MVINDSKAWRWLIIFLLRRAEDKKRSLEERKFFLDRAELHFIGWRNGKWFFQVLRLARRIRAVKQELGTLLSAK